MGLNRKIIIELLRSRYFCEQAVTGELHRSHWGSDAPTGSPFTLSTTSKSYVQNTTLQTEQLLLLRKRLEFFQDKLLQINWRNRSIILRRLYDKWCFDLSKLIIRNKKVGDKVVESALISKRPICLIRDSDDSELEVRTIFISDSSDPLINRNCFI